MLDQVEIFHGLSDEELKALDGSSTTRAFPKNTVVIHENDPADSLFVIESGKVKVYCSDKNGKEFIMNTLGPGTILVNWLCWTIPPAPLRCAQSKSLSFGLS